MRHASDVAPQPRFRLPRLAGALSLALFAFLLPVPHAGAGEPHTFTDTQGRTLVAEVLSVSDERVRIRRDDGRDFDLRLDTLCQADRQYLATWKVRRAIAAGDLVIQFHRVRTQSKLTHNKNTTTRDESWLYVIEVENRGSVSIDGLTLDYRIFHTDDTAKARKTDLPVKRIAGQCAFGIVAASAKAEVRTNPVALRITKRKDGREYSGTTKTQIEDELKGIWFRVLCDGEVVYEAASPGSLARTESWQVSRLDPPTPLKPRPSYPGSSPESRRPCAPSRRWP